MGIPGASGVGRARLNAGAACSGRRSRRESTDWVKFNAGLNIYSRAILARRPGLDLQMPESGQDGRAI
jgi:hypothetical protein